ncbi:MAG: ATP-grasp domain-containing protein, partial [Deltaproteobacteria bacterium]|nr:ATP-grasp domain-containing protein [Deltaproteobacteria bacterium]
KKILFFDFMKKQAIKKLLIANRSEIALRIMQAAKDLGIQTVAIYAPADRDMPFVQAADEAYVLEGEEASETYLNIPQILSIAKKTKVHAIHPGYGFLSENADFAAAVVKAGFLFVGPSAKVIKALGDKAQSKVLAKKAGVPTIPSLKDPLPKGKALEKAAIELGFPLLIKAAAGGGGKGMRVVESFKEFPEALAMAKREGKAYFGSDKVLIEKFLQKPRHVEVQILGDAQGNLLHLYERECSLQRRHQKVIEEAPSPSISPKLRQALCEAALKMGKVVDYVSAGTVEFIVDEKENFYLLEVNTRLQVEHAVTEWVTGVDLVKAQLKIAEGHALPLEQKDIVLRGHAMEARIYAEDPEQGFLPSEGSVAIWQPLQGPGIRWDESLKEGLVVSSLFDPMLAKVTAYGFKREEARQKLKRALGETVLLGIRHNMDFLKFVLDSQDFKKAYYHTGSLKDILEDFQKNRQDLAPDLWALAAILADKPVAKEVKATQGFDFPEALKGFYNV